MEGEGAEQKMAISQLMPMTPSMNQDRWEVVVEMGAVVAQGEGEEVMSDTYIAYLTVVSSLLPYRLYLCNSGQLSIK